MSGTRYVEIGGQLVLIDAWHRRQRDALRALVDDLQRPVSRGELAQALGVPVGIVSSAALVNRGYARVRMIAETREKGLWPCPESRPRLRAALQAWDALEEGTLCEWAEPRRGRGARGLPQVSRRLTVTGPHKSRIRTRLLQALDRMNISIDAVEPVHLGMILQVTRLAEMERSMLPPDEWRGSTTAARRARRTASARTSEMTAWLSWCEHKGFLTLTGLESDTLSDAWIDLLAQVRGDREALTRGRQIAVLAMQVGIDRPALMADGGFARVEAAVMTSPTITSDASARTTLARFRRIWNRVIAHEGTLPQWPRPEHPHRGRLPDGGLIRTWWEAHLLMDGKEGLLDLPGMEFQRQQATDLRDWILLEDPSRRGGRPLPPRPRFNRRGVRRLGARSPREVTPLRYLQCVSAYQRYLISHAETRIPAEEMTGMDWSRLFEQREPLLDFIDHEISRDLRRNGGILHSGTIRLWTIYTLCWAYFPAYLTARLRGLEQEMLATDPGERERLESLRHQAVLIERQVTRWNHLADDIKALIERRIVEHGGIRSRKDRSAISATFSHRDALRCADAVRRLRIEAEEDLRHRTRRLARSHGVRVDECPHGISVDLVDTSYCQLVVRELLLRLPSVLPWRPSVFRRARLGVHLDPVTLRLSVVGNDGKVARRPDGSLREDVVDLPSIEFFEHEDEVTHLVEVLRRYLDLARPWRWAHPSKVGRRQRAQAEARGVSWDDRLLLNRHGIPWESAATFATSIRSALEWASQQVNGRLEEGDEPIRLPTGYATRGSYIFRFLWGHRAVKAGASFGDVAQVLGNSERVVRRHYQDVVPTEHMNRVIRERRGRGQPASAGDPGEDELMRARQRADALEAELLQLRKQLSATNGHAETARRGDRSGAAA